MKCPSFPICWRIRNVFSSMAQFQYATFQAVFTYCVYCVTIADVLKSKGTRQRNPTRGRCALRKNGYGGFLGLGWSFIFFQLLVLDDLCDLPYFETWSSHYLKNTARGARVSWLMPALLAVHRWCYFLRFPTPTKEDTASEHMPLPRLQSSFYDPTTSNFFLSRAYLFCDDNVPLLRSRCFWVSEIDTLCLIN